MADASLHEAAGLLAGLAGLAAGGLDGLGAAGAAQPPACDPHLDAPEASSDDCSWGSKPVTAGRAGSKSKRRPAAVDDKRSNFRGVFWDRKNCRWRSQVGYQNRKIFMGYFVHAADAARAYDRKLVELHGALAKTNFAIEDYVPEILAHEAGTVEMAAAGGISAPTLLASGLLGMQPSADQISAGVVDAAAAATDSGPPLLTDAAAELPAMSAAAAEDDELAHPCLLVPVKGPRGKRKKCDAPGCPPVAEQESVESAADQADANEGSQDQDAPDCPEGLLAAGAASAAAAAEAGEYDDEAQAWLRVHSAPSMLAAGGAPLQSELVARVVSDPLPAHGSSSSNNGLQPPAKMQRLDNRESAALEVLTGMGGAAARSSWAGSAPALPQLQQPPTAASGYVGPMAPLQHAALLAAQQVPHLASYSQAARQPRDAYGRFQSKPAGGRRSSGAGQSAKQVPPPPPQQLLGGGGGASAGHHLLAAARWQPQAPALGLALPALPQPPPVLPRLMDPVPMELVDTAAEAAAAAAAADEQVISLQQTLLGKVVAAQEAKDTASLGAVLESALALVAAGGMTVAMSGVLRKYVAAYNSSQRELQQQHQQGEGQQQREPAAADKMCRWGSADGIHDDALPAAAAAAAAAAHDALSQLQPAAAGAAAGPAAAPRLHLLQPQLVQLPADVGGGQAQLQQFLRDSVVPAAADAAAALMAQQPAAVPGGQQPLVIVAPVIIPYAVADQQQQGPA